MNPIIPTNRPMPKGHYSPAMEHNGVIYVSGQLPLNENGEAQLGTIEAETLLCLQNIENILLAANSDRNHILKINVFIADIALWSRFNETYIQFMGNHKPARIVVPCNTLNRGCSIEIDCIAAVKS